MFFLYNARLFPPKLLLFSIFYAIIGVRAPISPVIHRFFLSTEIIINALLNECLRKTLVFTQRTSMFVEKVRSILGHQLLVVDDDAGIQRMLKIVLECEHFEVMTANDGMAALKCLEQKPPDLVLLDLMMPNMDGWSFVREMEQRGLRSSIPIIVLTADIYAKSLVESMQVDAWLVKPFHLVELLKSIRSFLQG
jgi:CheY-like chemotaxis protein